MSPRQSQAATTANPAPSQTSFGVINLAELRRFLNEILEPLMADTKPALVDRKGLARELSISTATLDHVRHAHKDAFPTVWVSSDSPRFNVRDVVAFLEAHPAAKEGS